MSDWLVTSADELAARVPDGAKIAVPHDNTGVAMEASRALIRRGTKDLQVVYVPVAGLRPSRTKRHWRRFAGKSAKPIRAS